MPARQRKPNELALQIIPLLLLGIGLVTTNNSVTLLNAEATALNAAALPLRLSIGPVFSGAAMHETHPLFVAELHGWLRGIQGNFDYLRISAILFYAAGLLLLGRAARYFSGPAGGNAVIWLGVLWPLGFHYGRLAAWYSFAFFLLAGLTLSYFKYLEDRAPRRLAPLFLFSACLIWTTNFAWAILACLVLDQFLRSRSEEAAAPFKVILGMAALLCVAFIPLAASFRAELSNGANFHQPAVPMLVNAASNLFSLFVSESVGLWYWRLSVPAAVGILGCVVLVARWVPKVLRRLLAYAAVLFAVLAASGLLQPHDLVLLAPWVLLPAGVAVEAAKPQWETFGLAAALLIVGAVGWYGVYARRYYSNPQFLEPWQEVATESAARIAGGAKVIADEPSFLFYLTYVLGLPRQSGPWQFEGMLPEGIKHPQVFSPQDWLSGTRSVNGKIILIHGPSDPEEGGPVDEVARQLDQSCGSISSRLRTRDEGYAWKKRYLPQLAAPQWRIEIREYDCDSSNSKQIFQLPPR